MKPFSLFLFVCSLTISLCAADAETRRFLWAQANTLAAEAQTPDDFRRAAAVYNDLAADGVFNAPLFLNLGAVFTLAGDTVPAIAAFARAESIAGISPESAAGIAAAYARRPAGESQTPPWGRTVFYPHVRFSCHTRTAAATVALGLALVFLLPPRVMPRLRNLWQTCAAVCAFFGVLCALSVAISRFDMRDFQPLHVVAGAEVPHD